MKILACSDLHCDRDATLTVVRESASADVVVIAGDFGIRGKRSTELFSILKGINAPIVLVAGNHDNYDELRAHCDTQNKLHLLEGSECEIEGVTFFGIGGEIPSRGDAEWNATLTESQATALFDNAPDHQVLVTHTPPFGYCDLQKDGTHEGSEAISTAIQNSQPLLCLCGHIHNSWGTVEVLGSTTVHNLGPTVNWHTV